MAAASSRRQSHRMRRIIPTFTCSSGRVCPSSSAARFSCQSATSSIPSRRPSARTRASRAAAAVAVEMKMQSGLWLGPSASIHVAPHSSHMMLVGKRWSIIVMIACPASASRSAASRASASSRSPFSTPASAPTPATNSARSSWMRAMSASASSRSRVRAVSTSVTRAMFGSTPTPHRPVMRSIASRLVSIVIASSPHPCAKECVGLRASPCSTPPGTAPGVRHRRRPCSATIDPPA